MEPETDWKKDLARELRAIGDRYTTDHYERTPATQLAYQRDLERLETTFQDRLDGEDKIGRRSFDNRFRETQLGRLNEQERATWPQARDDNDLWDTRAGQRAERDDLWGDKRDPAYRQTPAYRDGMQAVLDEQVRQREKMDRAFRDVEAGLNDRFGFTRDREQSRRDDRAR